MESGKTSETTACMSCQELGQERDYTHLLQEDGQMAKSPRCLNWEAVSDCGKEMSYSIRKLVDSGRSKLKKKQLHVFAQMNLPTAALVKHGAPKTPSEVDVVGSIATAPKSILYYA